MWARVSVEALYSTYALEPIFINVLRAYMHQGGLLSAAELRTDRFDASSIIEFSMSTICHDDTLYEAFFNSVDPRIDPSAVKVEHLDCPSGKYNLASPPFH